nr:hypothetical protein [Rickettsia felis]
MRYIDINESNLSIVVTDSPANNNNTRISKIIDDTIKLGNFSDEQKIIINKIKDSIYLLPQASEQAKDYKDLLNITDDNYIIPDEYNKITIDGENLTYILNSINVIDKEILISINEFKTYIEKKWKQNIESNLSFEDISAKTDKLKQLIDIVNCYKQLENNAKTIGSFLETVKKLNQLLETPKLENKLENLLNYLKYLSDIKFSEKENLVTINSAKWFNDLFSNLGAYNIKEKLLESFKHTICKDKDSFYNKLNETIEKFYEDIKNNDVLDLKAINNIYNLKKLFTAY